MVRADPRSLVLVGVGAAILLLVAVVQLSSRRLRLPPLVVPLLVATCLVDFVSPGRAPENAHARWMEDLLWGLPGRQADRFVKLPSVSSVEYGEVLGLVVLPLREARRSRRDRRERFDHWESAPIRLPSGKFVVSSPATGDIYFL